MASLTLLWVIRIYIVWVKDKKVKLKNPQSKEFRGYLAIRPYPRDTREILQVGMTFSRVSLLQAFRKIHLFFNSCSILHQPNTKHNTIKSHKIQGTKLKQLQHFLSWNKANIKHSCKSQLYILKYVIR